MLLHPQTGGSVNEEVIIQGHRMRFKTLDLTADPEEFEVSLRGLVSK